MIQTAACFSCSQNGTAATFHVRTTTERGVLTNCPSGHQLAIVFQAAGWARLFERGLERVAIGEMRDAVLDMYTAFEMYLSEVPVRARYDREAGESPTQLHEELKLATKRSENAMGAARAVASLVSRRPAITWSNPKTTEIRNQAIHSGVYPSERQAKELCDEIERTIIEFESALGSVEPINAKPYEHALWEEEVEAFGRAHPGVKPIFAAGWDIFQWYDLKNSRRTTASARIEEYRGRPWTVLRAAIGI